MDGISINSFLKYYNRNHLRDEVPISLTSSHSMEVSIVHAALPIEYSWDCPYIQLILHGKLLVETVSYRFQDTVNIQFPTIIYHVISIEYKDNPMNIQWVKQHELCLLPCCVTEPSDELWTASGMEMGCSGELLQARARLPAWEEKLAGGAWNLCIGTGKLPRPCAGIPIHHEFVGVPIGKN